MPGAHKIGSAISGPRITGGNFMDMRIFLKIIRADFWDVDVDSNFSVFRDEQFTEWPGSLHKIAFPVEILTKPLIH